MYRIIGNMTGNSMDAIDLVLTEFHGDNMRDICTFSTPYSADMQQKMDTLRNLCYNKTLQEIEQIPEFLSIHNEYITEIAKSINMMCEINGIDKKSVDAIGFHGKTLDHNPPSKAKASGRTAYTLQMGSGQMLADLTDIQVVYDFRSDAIMAGFEGAPLISPHNARISFLEGNGIYYNGGNTSNFAIINHNKDIIQSDAGPFNEYTDSFVRLHTDKPFDENGTFGKNGKLDYDLLQELFNIGRNYYQLKLPKSGDPAYYHKEKIFSYVLGKNINFNDAIHTFEYFAAYIAVQALSLIPEDIEFEKNIILFGGGWKNPVVKKSFENILFGQGFILSEHKTQFNRLFKRFDKNIKIKYSMFGKYMEARLFADLARYKLENKVWEIPEIINTNKQIVLGRIAKPQTQRQKYSDYINRAAKGWQIKSPILR